MDRRGRIAPKRQPERTKHHTALAPKPLVWLADRLASSARLRRWGSTILTLRIPRGAGASASAFLILASVSYGAFRGGHVPEIAINVQDLCDAAANKFGFRITEVAITGEHHLSRTQILNTAGVTGRSSLLFLDVAQARARLLRNPWIEQASVFKLYPGRLQIIVKERKPFALWQMDGRIASIAEDGVVLQYDVPQGFASLPLVVGHGAEYAAPDLLRSIARLPDIARRVEAAVLVAERRWNLHLKNGLEVLLPENDPERALSILADLDRTKKLLSRDIVVIDLRLPDRVTVRQSDGAAQARDAVTGAAEKKATKKNGSAA